MNKPHWVSLRFPQVNGGEFGMCRYGSSRNGFNWRSAGFTLPAMRTVSSAERLHGTFALYNTACSEMLRNNQPFVLGCSGTLRLPNSTVSEDNLDDVFLPDVSHFPTLRGEQQKVFLEKQPIKRITNQQEDATWATPNMLLVVQDIMQRQETMRKQPSVGSAPTTKVALAQWQETTAGTLK